MSTHFERLCSVIDDLSSELDFDVPPLSQDSGLSQDLEFIISRDPSWSRQLRQEMIVIQVLRVLPQTPRSHSRSLEEAEENVTR